ncbi:copper-translocating P-type ATPase [Flavobacterium cauense R2A-7]|uniref:P-type Cu(+) transporter n=1 Tax=Flavobacterium cauense R2A-7 TaxID=1341154 RepID=V6RZZ8_9FLAO|nr:heavy metal translocating P-type ATPase [Flavobacterium cauense]ESU19709.1 copper-translocating P-type ATPase [Flavobacterium cauense R2A-7]KGO79807.1 copper transporter [Flavobacterium cauense R2A-7]TWI09230.1 Cu2+-exporting ATPase [Flavobacterium cauense R2A-7]
METNNKILTIPLEDVHSEHCALIVDDALNKTDGVLSHKVELNNQLAKIEVDSKQFKLGQLTKNIRDLGYNVTTVKKSYPVEGMTCASCAVSVESILSFEEGVISSAVNYANATATVEYVPGLGHPENFKKAIQSIGYDLIIAESENQEDEIQERQNEHYLQLKKRTIAAALFTLPVFLIGMFFMNMPFANEIMWVLATPVLFWFGKNFFINAWKQAKHRKANMDTLVALSTGIAYVFSVFNTLNQEFWHSRGLHAHVYFEAATVVITFILLGKVLEERAKGNTASAIKKLMGLQPKTVTRLTKEGQQEEVKISAVTLGDVLLAKPGEKIAVDGKVISGSSFVDESMISGEPVAVSKNAGDEVFAGTINQKGSLQYSAEKVGSETLLSQIIQMVQNAQGSKAPVQKLVDKIAGIFVPIVLLISIVTLIVWIIFGGENGLTHGLLAMVTVLVIACPCALGLATPTAIMVGVGKGAEKGILIKDAESLERAQKVDTVIFDKTGTITEGKPSVAASLWKEENAFLTAVLFAIEKQSEHPLAEAVVANYSGISTVTVSDFESITGFGVKAKVEGKTYFVGNKRLLDSHQVAIDNYFTNFIANHSQLAHTLLYFSDSEQVLAILAVADKIKETSIEAVRQLKEQGIEVIMLTGDNEQTAASVAKTVGVSRYKAGVLPEDKLSFVKALQSEGKTVAMVGDGVNDSAALAQANVSIAMGKGSDIAMDVAHMTIISSDLLKVSQAILLSRQTVATIKQNLFWAFIYNIIGIPIAAGVLYPINGFLLNPMIAGAAMAMSSVSVVSNSLRLKFRK